MPVSTPTGFYSLSGDGSALTTLQPGRSTPLSVVFLFALWRWERADPPHDDSGAA